LIAVGDKPHQRVGSVVFGIPVNPNTSTGNEMFDPAMRRTPYGGDSTHCRIEIKRNHGNLWVFDDAINGRQKKI
jgi:hypothetical protein